MNGFDWKIVQIKNFIKIIIIPLPELELLVWERVSDKREPEEPVFIQALVGWLLSEGGDAPSLPVVNIIRSAKSRKSLVSLRSAITI